MTYVMERSVGDLCSEAEIEKQEALDVQQQAVEQLEMLDESLAELIVHRTKLACEIGRAKQQMGIPVYNGARELEVRAQFIALATDAGVDPELSSRTIESIIVESRRVQGEPGIRGGGQLTAEAAQDIIAQVRTEITQADMAIATLLGQRVVTAQILRDASALTGRPPYRSNERDELSNFVELTTAGGVREAWARSLFTPYIATARF